MNSSELRIRQEVNMIEVHSEIHKKRKNWTESTTKTTYYYNILSCDVMKRVIMDVNCSYNKSKNLENEIVENRCLSHNEIPQIVREKIIKIIRL